ncbi:metallophosphoesterase [Candidatus Poribacteria bacterium]
MARTKRIFISDIHLTSQERYDDEQYSSWYDPDIHGPRLLGFLDNYVLANAGGIKDVVLLGDIFNTWMCPCDMEPPTYAQIFQDNRIVMDKFKELTDNGINVFYSRGNHDFDLESGEIEDVFKKNGNENERFRVIGSYLSGRIHAEHGNEYDLFNRPDRQTDPAFARPIGYFISRLVASAGGDRYATLDMAGYLDDLLEAAVTSQNIYTSIIEALAERAGLDENARILMPNSRELTISQVKARYATLDYSKRELLANLYERRYLDGTADRLCKRFEYNVVVFGHTHKAKIDKDFFLVDDRIYANTGSWCKDNAYCVEINKTSRTHVRLYRINDDGTVGHRTRKTV